VLIAFVIGAIGVEFATVFNNSMMPSLVPKERLGRLSGLGWGMGYVGGLVSLVVALGFLAANPQTGKTLFGLAPLFGLDPVLREGDRVTGPLTALWFLVFVLPLFLFTPDGKPGLPLSRAIGSGWAAIRETVREARRHRNLGLFLLANMIYADGLVALFAFGGIYAVGTFGWHTIELGIFGILLTITGTIGAISGGWLDDRFGPKRVIIGSLMLLIFTSAAILSVERDKILFVISVAPPLAGGGCWFSGAAALWRSGC
jgi:UMF1 family MFS transporter